MSCCVLRRWPQPSFLPVTSSNLLDDLCAVLRPVAIDISWRPQSPDNGDDLVVDAAVNGLAAVIATFNLKHLREPAARFGIVAETPADLLRRLL